MPELLSIIFLICVLPVLHTYLIYPLLMMARGRRNGRNFKAYVAGEDLPRVAVLIAAYNEEDVIAQKINSVFSSEYPAERLRVIVGSDASDDRTEEVVKNLQSSYPSLQLIRFNGRVGKISIINQLQSEATEEILVMTDANVIFTRETLGKLIAPFKDPSVGMVAGNILKEAVGRKGIAWQEKVYLSLENSIKQGESNAFGLVMGAEGGCYAMRNALFSKVPLKFNVDDFYITMQVLLREKVVLFSPGAVCLERVPGDAAGEYRRKVRISSGNFQNLLFFRRVLLRPFSGLGFAFWSHKVLRWLTPFFLIGSFLSSLALAMYSPVFAVLASLQMLGLLMPAFNALFQFQGPGLKFISHFYLMNYALLAGFFRFVGGIRSSVWQPQRGHV